jgi:hypothetical protein
VSAYPTAPAVRIRGGLHDLDVEHVLYYPTVTASAKAQTVRASRSPKPLGLVRLTVLDEDGTPVGTVEVKTADLRAALAIPKRLS